MRSRPVVAAAALVLLPAGVAAQLVYVEPMPMREGVRLPSGVHATNPLAAAQLGISTPETFTRHLASFPGGPFAVDADFPDPLDVPERKDILVIPALFSDSPEPHIAVSEMRRVLFEGPYEGGTFTEFWTEVSRGAFEASGDVSPWVRTDVTLFEASGEMDGHGWLGQRRLDYVRQAVELADEHLDFGTFDNDGPDGVPNSGDDDGIVDALAIQFLEVAGSCGGPAIWPHFSAVVQEAPDGGTEPLATDDLRPDGSPVRVYTYFAQSATDCTGAELQGPNVIAHEFGHLLGLPDWYHIVEGVEPQHRHWNIGCWGLMGAGAWGCGTEFTDAKWGPTHPSALSRYALGWSEPVVAGEVEDQEFVLEPVQTSGEILVVRLDPGLPEWFLVEYRPRLGFDEALPAGGVLIYHYDTYGPGRRFPPEAPPFKPYHLVEADGDHALRKVQRLGGNRGVAEDAFGISGAPERLDASTEPSTRLHIGEASSVTIHAIQVEEDRARIRLTSRPVLTASEWTLPARVPVLDPFTGQLTVSGGTPGYEVTAELTGVPVLDLETSVEEGVVTLEGRPRAAGEVRVMVVVRDADGNTTVRDAQFRADDLDLPEAELVAALLGDSPVIDAGIRDYLDVSGNWNSTYDLGDLRAYVLRR